MIRRLGASPHRTGRGLNIVLIAAALALLGHLLGPHTDNHVITASTASAAASEPGTVSEHGHAHHRFAQAPERSCSGADPIPTHNDGGHGPSCGYLEAGAPENPLAAHPARPLRTVPAVPPPHILTVFGQQAGERDPPSLVHELQVMRI